MNKWFGRRARIGLSDLRALLVLTIVVTCVNALRPTASYRVLEVGGAAAEVGVVAAAYAFLPALVAIPLGRFIDRSGKQMLPLGLLLVGTGAGLGATTDRVMILALSQAVIGLGQLLTAVYVQTIVAEREGLDIDKGFAYIAIAASAGQLLGPLTAGVILNSPNGGIQAGATSVVFIVFSALAVAAVPLAIRVPRPHGRSSFEPIEKSSLKSIVRVRGMPQALATSVAVLVSLDLILAYLPLVGEARGISPGTVGMFLSLRALSGLTSRLAIPRLVVGFGRRTLLLISTTGAGIGMMGLALLLSPWALAAAICVIGFGLGIGTPMTMTWTALFAPKGAKSTAVALRITSNRVGQVLAPLAFGILAVGLGPGAVFIGTGTLLLSGVVWLGLTMEESPL